MAGAFRTLISFAENIRMSDAKKTGRKSYIKLNIALDAGNIPENIQWEASDDGQGLHEAKAMLLGLWDKKQSNGISIDLWTKEMTVPEMHIFFYQSFLSMSDTITRATQDKALGELIRSFASAFMEKVKSAS
jgi:gliding motility-associated protein GldC